MKSSTLAPPDDGTDALHESRFQASRNLATGRDSPCRVRGRVALQTTGEGIPVYDDVAVGQPGVQNPLSSSMGPFTSAASPPPACPGPTGGPGHTGQRVER